jgi:hypothetical protein
MTTRTARAPMVETPWGVAQHVRPVGPDGIFSADTSSHGGYFVPSALLDKIDPRGRADAKKWSGSENWYEEDCCWAWVVLAFPEHFPPTAVAGAYQTCKARGFDGPTTGPAAEVLWRHLSGNHGPAPSDAAAIYRRCGFVAFSGYPLQRAG